MSGTIIQKSQDFTPEQIKQLLNLLAKNIVNWGGRKLFNINQIFCQKLVTARVSQQQNNQCCVIDAVKGYIVYDSNSQPLFFADLRFPNTQYTVGTALYLWHNGSLKNVTTDNTGTALYIK